MTGGPFQLEHPSSTREQWEIDEEKIEWNQAWETNESDVYLVSKVMEDFENG